MKVKITTTVDIDPERWAQEFGTSSDPEEVRRDVKDYLQNGCNEQLLAVGQEQSKRQEAT